MSGLRQGLEELAQEAPVYGDLDRAFGQADRARRRHAGLAATLAVAAAVVALVVGTLSGARPQTSEPSPSKRPATPDRTGAAASPLQDGLLDAGRYRYHVTDTCELVAGCPPGPVPALPDILVTVPPGWRASNEFHLIEPDTRRGTQGPTGAGLVLGWTTTRASLYSDPCRHSPDQVPDQPVAATVDAFVDAVVAHPRLDVTEPRPVRVGGHPGRFFTLTGPSDISACEDWRPWDPSPYLQGPGNRWDLWVLDVRGVRIVLMAGYYPGTPAATRDQMRAMVASVKFQPSSTDPSTPPPEDG